MRQTGRLRRAKRAGDHGFEAAIARARAGHSDGYTALYRSLDREIHGFALGRGASDPEGVVNETFLRAFRNLDTFDGSERDFRSWVFAICRNQLIDESRRHLRRPTADISIDDITPVADGSDVAVDAIERAGRDDLEALLGSLTDDQRDVITLRVIADLSLREVAEVLDKPIGAVKSLQRRALSSLSREIERSPVSPDRDRTLS